MEKVDSSLAFLPSWLCEQTPPWLGSWGLPKQPQPEARAAPGLSDKMPCVLCYVHPHTLTPFPVSVPWQPLLSFPQLIKSRVLSKTCCNHSHTPSRRSLPSPCSRGNLQGSYETKLTLTEHLLYARPLIPLWTVTATGLEAPVFPAWGGSGRNGERGLGSEVTL